MGNLRRDGGGTRTAGYAFLLPSQERGPTRRAVRVIDRLATAYHNGPGYLRDFLAAGKTIPNDLPPKGKAYVLRARRVWPKYQICDQPAGPPAVA